jgi:hypothetical protein
MKTVRANLLLILVLLVALIVRLPFISRIPSVINGDESGSLVHSLQILYTPRLDLFDLTHDGSVSYVVFLPKALAIYLFGLDHSLLAIRLVTALNSVLALIPFYFIILPRLGKPFSVLSVLLFACTPWYLSFSRDSTVNAECLVWGLGLIYIVSRLVVKPSILLTASSSLFAVGVLHNYLGGRIYLLIALLILARNFHKVRYHAFVFLALVLIFFTPQLAKIVPNPTRYFERPAHITIFNMLEPYYHIDPENGLAISLHQIYYLFRGFFLFDPRVSQESIENSRFMPPGSSALPIILTPLFLVGLVSSVWKRTNLIWISLYFTNLTLLQFPSVYIPNWARGISLLPSLVFFVGYGGLVITRTYRLTAVFVSVLLIGSALRGVGEYWSWVGTASYNDSQRPSISVTEYPIWQQAQLTRIKIGLSPFTFYQWQDPLWKKENL